MKSYLKAIPAAAGAACLLTGGYLYHMALDAKTDKSSLLKPSPDHIPVSYTHLFTSEGPPASSLADIILPVSVIRSEGPILVIRLKTVSYTHLDVYKRQ